MKVSQFAHRQMKVGQLAPVVPERKDRDLNETWLRLQFVGACTSKAMWLRLKEGGRDQRLRPVSMLVHGLVAPKPSDAPGGDLLRPVPRLIQGLVAPKQSDSPCGGPGSVLCPSWCRDWCPPKPSDAPCRGSWLRPVPRLVQGLVALEAIRCTRWGSRLPCGSP